MYVCACACVCVCRVCLCLGGYVTYFDLLVICVYTIRQIKYLSSVYQVCIKCVSLIYHHHMTQSTIFVVSRLCVLEVCQSKVNW